MSQQEERLSGALQENILTALCFDDEHCKIIRGAVTPQLFESSVFREVAGHAIDFIDQYGEAIKEHLPDHLEDILKGEDERKAKTYQRLLDNLYASKDSVNAKYVVSQLHRFVRAQYFKSALVKAIEAVEDGRIDEAEIEMHKGLKSQVVAFNAGLDLKKPEAITAIFDKPENEGFELGIPELDRRGIIPRRGELYSFLAPRKRGKSWFITHCSKQAMIQRWNALVITLELSEAAYGVRTLQATYSITRNEAEVRVTKLLRDKSGSLEGMIEEKIERDSMQDPEARSRLIAKTKRDMRRRKAPRIKGFPMNSLTLTELEAFLDGLERFEGYVPDVLLIDYPRLMKHDPKNLRLELGNTFAGIRGLCQRRNMAGVIVHQTNRISESASLVSADMAEEDISIVAVSDVVLTYSRTPAEYKLGLGRLYAEYVRNAEGGFQVLLTQAYALGQFCLDSHRIDSSYWEMMEKRNERDGRRRTRNEDQESHDAEQD